MLVLVHFSFFFFKNIFSIKLNRVVFERPKLYLKKTVFEVRENVMAQRWNLMAVAGLCEFPLKLVLEVGEITYPKGQTGHFPLRLGSILSGRGLTANCWEYLYVLYKCSSVGCLKCVQLQNWFRLRIGSFQVNMERSAEYAFLNQLNYKSW